MHIGDIPGTSWDVVLIRALQARQSAVMFSVVDSYIYGNVECMVMDWETK